MFEDNEEQNKRNGELKSIKDVRAYLYNFIMTYYSVFKIMFTSLQK